MPMKNGMLTEEERDTAVTKFRKWEVEKLGGDLVCELCTGRNWMLTPFLIGNVSDGLSLGEAFFRLPSVAFSCMDCGNVKMFLAQKMGIEPIRETRPNGEKEGNDDGS